MNRRFSKTKRSLLAVLAIGTLWSGLGLSEAFAGDEKRYSATFCRPKFDKRTHFGVSGGMSIYNKSTTEWLVVYCPIIRDEMEWDDKVEWVNIDYFNPFHGSKNMVCWLQVRDPKGGHYIDGKHAVYVAGQNPGAGTMSITWNKHSWHYLYYLACTIPPSGGQRESERIKLSGYWVREKS